MSAVFAFRVDDGALHVLPDAASAPAQCAAAEVRAQQWLFFADDGEPLRPQFLEADGRYFLRPWASCSSARLDQVLHLVTAVQGTPPLDTLDAVQTYVNTKGWRHE
ncbi:hypothetical protein [Uliginosibacterium sp. H1]|uniref:hypothetical protein n=1 Tax=Uliginosibacterium sp. H1 TaxID=3114757 RepID=UPI002E19074C|nr:hypothetical protein [Uliginosibacterium sp. H1]